MPIPAICGNMYINQGKELLVYEAGYASEGWNVWKNNTLSDDYSQIVLFNYKNGTKTGISKVGKFAKYQHLSVSPKFINVIFGHEILEDYIDEDGGRGKRLKQIDFYHYNIKNKQTNLLSVNTFWLNPLWINENVFFYTFHPIAEYTGEELLTVYKFNLRLGSQVKFMENINHLIIP